MFWKKKRAGQGRSGMLVWEGFAILEWSQQVLLRKALLSRDWKRWGSEPCTERGLRGEKTSGKANFHWRGPEARICPVVSRSGKGARAEKGGWERSEMKCREWGRTQCLWTTFKRTLALLCMLWETPGGFLNKGVLWSSFSLKEWCWLLCSGWTVEGARREAEYS